MELELSQDETIESIKKVIPDIDFDPDRYPNCSPFAKATLRPNATSDPVTLDYNLVRILKSLATQSHNQKLAGLVFLAVSLGHGLAAHVLRFRCLGAQLQSDGQPFETPPGITCCEAGTACETRALEAEFYQSVSLRTI